VHSLPRKKNVPGRITRLQPLPFRRLHAVVAERIRYRRIRLVAFRSSGSPPHTRETGGEKDEFFSFTCCEGVHDEAEPPTEVYIYIYTRAYGPRTPYAYGIRLEEMTGVPPTLGSVWSVQCGVGFVRDVFFSPSCCPMVGPTHQLRNDLSRPPVPAGKIPCNHQITAGIEYPAHNELNIAGITVAHNKIIQAAAYIYILHLFLNYCHN
jgi:hypothetical protein